MSKKITQTDNAQIDFATDLSVTQGTTTKNTTIVPSLFERNSDLHAWGHTFLVGDEEIQCVSCEMSFEIPQILEQSSPFTACVYKFYLLGKFKGVPCDSEPRMAPPNQHTDPTPTTTPDNWNAHPSHTRWLSGPYIISPDGGEKSEDKLKLVGEALKKASENQTI